LRSVGHQEKTRCCGDAGKRKGQQSSIIILAKELGCRVRTREGLVWKATLPQSARE